MVKKITSRRAWWKWMMERQEGCTWVMERLVDAYGKRSNFPKVYFYVFIPALCVCVCVCVCVCSCETTLRGLSAETYSSGTSWWWRGLVSNHHILFNFTFHVKATYNYRGTYLVIASPRVPSKPSQKNAYMLLIQYLCPLYHVAAGLLGSLSVGSNLRGPR